MARDGAGSYSLPEAAFVYDTVISETAVNSNFSDIATALTASLAKDGQTDPTANLPMATFRHTGVGNAQARTDYAAAGQVQNSAFLWLGTSSGTDTITASLSPAITAYAAGQSFRFIAGGTNTGATTININSVGAVAVQKNGSALSVGDINSGDLYQIDHDGTQFQLTPLSPAATSTDLVNDTTPQLGGPLDTNSQAVNFSEGSAVASATSPDIWATDGNTVHITGTTQIDDFADAPRVGAVRWLIFDGALTLTHGSGITLPGGASITTAAGDMAEVYADAVDAFRVKYFRASGLPVVEQYGLEEILVTTASDDATVEFTLDTSTYTSFEIEFDNVVPATDGQGFLIRTSTDGGSTFDSGGSDYNLQRITINSSQSVTGAASIGTGITIAGDVGNDTNESVSGVVRIINPAGTGFTHLNATVFAEAADGNHDGYYCFGARLSAADVDAIQFRFVSGNVASGTFILRGIR